jgi:hypothetical protein
MTRPQAIRFAAKRAACGNHMAALRPIASRLVAKPLLQGL